MKTGDKVQHTQRGIGEVIDTNERGEIAVRFGESEMYHPHVAWFRPSEIHTLIFV